MEASFRDFVNRPQNKAILEQHQRREAKRALRLKERQAAEMFQSKVLESPYEVQKAIAPYLEDKALRRIVQTFTNDVHQDFGLWAANPLVLQMLAQAKELLSQGKLSELDVQLALQVQMEVCTAEPSSALQTAARLETKDLVSALNEQLAERRQGNQFYAARDYDKALLHYTRARAIVDGIAGMGSIEQKEVDRNKATVCLNIAAVHLMQQHNADAAACCTDALQCNVSSKALLRRAKAYLRLHEYQAAGTDIQAVLEMDAIHPEALQAQQDLRYMQQRSSKASQALFANIFHQRGQPHIRVAVHTDVSPHTDTRIA